MARLVILLVLLPLLGCAEVHVKPVAANDPTAEGVRIYRPWPYLLVTADTTKDGTTTKYSILYLPKTDEPFAVTVNSGWGTVDGSVKLQDGWMLTELGAKLDSKGPETITAATGLLTAVAGIAAKETSPLPVGLYRIEFDNGNAVRLTRLSVNAGAANATPQQPGNNPQ